ncbi:MAG: hypothetical protein QOD03_1457, partial [Verrucomicrobiota bacterium]
MPETDCLEFKIVLFLVLVLNFQIQNRGRGTRTRMKIRMTRSENLLIVADSDHEANMLYAVGMFVPDPFIFLRLRGRDFIVMSDLEIDRAR